MREGLTEILLVIDISGSDLTKGDSNWNEFNDLLYNYDIHLILKIIDNEIT